MNKKTISISSSKTESLGEEFSKKLTKNIIVLYGDLGSGKTTFAKGLAKGLGIEKRIVSPTFMIIRSYAINNKKIKAKYFYHIDLYRIENNFDEILTGEIEEIIKDNKNIVAIEWPEKIEKLLPVDAIKVYFNYLDENKRGINFLNE